MEPIRTCHSRKARREPWGLSATKDSSSFAAMTQYLDQGGRIFGTDFMYTVWKNSPDPKLASAATIPGGRAAGR